MPAPRAPGRGGVTAMHMALIASVAFALTAIVLLVLLYTDQEGLKNELRTLREDKSKLLGAGEERSISLYSAARADGTSLAKLLDQARIQTAKLITATESENDVPSLTQKVSSAKDAASKLIKSIDEEQRGETSQGDGEGRGAYAASFVTTGLLDAFKSLTAILESEHARLVSAEDEKRQLNQRATQLASDMQNQREQFEKTVAEINTQMGDIEKSRTASRTDRDKQIADMQQRVDELNRVYRGDIQKVKVEAEMAKGALAEMKARDKARMEKLGDLQIGPQPLVPARKADGTVVEAKAGEDIVYIDLGRGMHLVPGMNFAVYPAGAAIPTEGRAKARIQVQRIFERTSECKVVELLGNQVVRVGDQIANPIYDRKRPMKFRVLGEFDLNGDGTPDPQAVGTFEAIIKDWNGMVADRVGPDVDFVVLGIAPRRPVTVGDTSPERKERDALAQRLFDDYNAELDKARNLGIPILVQDVFLNFLGYGEHLPRTFP
ncbi:MAG TPA: hypothetical protein VGM03_23035 [Phycisphaerae bacterium]